MRALTLVVALFFTFKCWADCLPHPPGLIGWWPGDGNANNVLGTNNGTLQGGATASAPGLVAAAFNFDGTNGYVSIPDSPALRPTNFTIEAWIKVDALDTPSTANAGAQFYVFKQNSRASFFEGYWLGKSRTSGTDTFIFGVSSAAGVFVPVRSATIQTGVWYHVAAVRGANYLQLYTNGVLSAQAPVNFPQDYGNQPLYFGSSGVPTYDSKLKGRLDEVTIYNRALSSNEIAAGFAVGAAGKCKAPVITTQPQGQSVTANQAASFTVTATGFSPLGYQWRFNDTAILGATNASLTLNNLQAASQGNYSVLVSNALGAALSSNAFLEVTAPQSGVPYISGFNPISAVPGTVASITGFNFSPVAASNIVRFGAVRANVVTASATNLIVTVPIGASYAPVSVTVTGLTAFARSSFLPTFPGDGQPISGSSFASRQDITAAYGNFQTHIADFDGDGKPDLVANDGYPHRIWLYRNTGNVGFLSASSFAAPVIFLFEDSPNGPGGLASADMDGDGKLDLLFTDPNKNRVGIMRNVSQPGTLSANSFAAPLYVTTQNIGTYVRVRDLDGDGRPDLVSCNFGNASISVVKNLSVPGTLDFTSFAPALNLPVNSGPHDVVVEDFDGDGKPDIVAAHSGSYNISLFRNISTPGDLTAASFAPRVDMPALIDQLSITAGDVDGDGKSDLIIGGRPNTIYVYRNQASPGSLTSGSFAAPVFFANPGWVHNVVLGDINGDGKPDLVAVGELDSFLSVYQNQSTPGSFTASSLAPRVDFGTGWNAWGVSVGDLDGDTRPDAVFCNNYETFASSYRNVTPFGGPPFVITQPTGYFTNVYTVAKLSATLGGAAPLSYQWFFNGTPLVDDGRISGATSNTLTFIGTLTNDTGAYWLVATNAFGAVTSSVAPFNVGFPPTVQNPPNQTNLVGSTVTFTALAAGAGHLYYQWRLDGSNLSNDARISGATNALLSISNLVLSDAGNYSVRVANLFGTVSSYPAYLTVVERPAILNDPVGAVVSAATNFTFTVGATGTAPLGYQWRFNQIDLPLATNTALLLTNVQAANAGDYTVVVTNLYGSVTSAVAPLAVTPVAPVFTLNPGSRTATKGAEVVFTAATKGSEPLSYQWMVNSTNIPGATGPTFILTNAQYSNSGNYVVQATNAVGAADSAVAGLTVTPPPGFLWARKAGGVSNDEGRSVARDSQGSLYVAGTFFGTATFGTNTLTTHPADIDVFLAKYNPAGEVIWARSGGSLSLDVATGVAVDAEGNVCLVGGVGPTPNFSGATLNVRGTFDAFLAKYSGNGDLLWITNFGGATTSGATESINAVTVDGAGRIYVAGQFTGTGFFGDTIVSNTLSSAAFLACCSAAGNVEWVRASGGSATATSASIGLDSQTNVLVVGSFNTPFVTFGPLALTNTSGIVGTAASSDVFVTKYDAHGTVQWARKAGGTSSDTGRGIAVDGGGNAYVIGDFNGAWEIYTAPGQTPDVFLIKYDPAGTLQWTQRGGGTSTDVGNAVAVDAGGNVFITGSYSLTANFGGIYYPSPNGGLGSFVGGINLTNSGSTDAFIAMYTTAGEVRWALKAGGNSLDAGRALVTDHRGGLLLSGSFATTATFGHITNTATGSADFFLAKLAAFDADAPATLVAQPVSQTNAAGSSVTLSAGVIAPGPISYQWQFNGGDIPGATNLSLTLYNIVTTNAGSYSVNITTPNGNLSSTPATLTVVTEPDFLWAKHLGGAGNDECLAVAADANGNTYAAGYFSGPTDFGGTNLTSNGGEDIFVAKFDAAQNPVWLRQFGGTNNDRATGLALDNAGNVIVAGQFTAVADFDGTNLTSFGSNDVFVAKLDNAGALLWARQAGGTNNDFARSIAADTNGDIAVAGSFQTVADFGSVTLTNRNLIHPPLDGDMFVARYSAAGELLWAKGAGGTSDDRARSVAFDRGGNILVAGGFNTSITFDSVALSSFRKSYEIFVAKYGATGNVVWARSPGTAVTDVSTFVYDDEAMTLAVDREANFFLAGYFSNVGIFGSNTVVSASTNAPDLFLAKYDDTGNPLWVRTGGGGAADSALALTTDNSGNALLAGSLVGPAQFGSQSITGIGGADAFAAMYDTMGNLLKLRKLGGMGEDAAQAAAYDGRGNLVLGGFHTGPSVIGITPLPGVGLRDAFVTKLSLFDPDLAPLITGQPMEQTVGYGKTLDLGVGVTSGSPPSYQWLFNNAPLSGATNGTLRLTNFQYAAVGDYAVIITNAFGAVTSTVATVTVEIVPEFPWLRRAGGTGDDQALALALDAKTNLYMAGYFSGTAMFANGFYGTNVSLVSTGLTDIFLAKYNTSGQLLWARSAGGPREEAAQSLAIDPAGNVLITGYFRSIQARFGSLVATNTDPFNDFLGDIFVAKYDAQGNPLWVKRAGGWGWDMGRSIATDAEGNAYITGFCYWLANFDGFAITNGNANFVTNHFVAKYDSNGAAVWVKNAASTSGFVEIAPTPTVQAFGITVTADTNVIVTGHFLGTANFGNGYLTNHNGTTGGGSVFLTKYDRNGNLLWAKKGVSGTPGIGVAVRADSSGNIYATSHRPAFGITAQVLAKYDPNGFPVWLRGVSQGNGQLQGGSLAFDPDGNILMAGGVTGALTFEGTILSANGFIAKYRPDGIPLWVMRAGSWCSGVVSDSSGGGYLAGRYSGTGFFGPSGTNSLTGFGANDIFLVKLGVKSPTAAPQVAVKTIATDSGTTLQVTTTGTGPFAYQWRFNGTNISGATGSSYVLNGAKWMNAGLYSVVISNPAGSYESAAAAVNVAPKLYSELNGGNLLLTWGGGLTLQSATNPTGPYVDLSGAVSPHHYATSNDPLRFFRLKSEPFALTLSNQPGGGMALSGAGISGYNFILLGSTNLIHWSPVATNISPFSFTETNPLPVRFYRAVLAQ